MKSDELALVIMVVIIALIFGLVVGVALDDNKNLQIEALNCTIKDNDFHCDKLLYQCDYALGDTQYDCINALNKLGG